MADGGRVRWESSEVDLTKTHTPATEQVRLHGELMPLGCREN